ncbi:CoA transferase [Paradesulfitobacterium ferrireducens]|uniref:CoA transferase n=1 Tax=Paradesulfitobacterium ferrireducens TaxID=2816476 RepID=UPI001A8CEA99|nr:CoA transferase [Paradesulfitobacterium ferrireducens]
MKPAANTKNPMEGIRVLDFGQYVAGPATAAMLADQGAEVIRIDPPGGPRWNSPAMETLNRRKKSIILDLKKEDDLIIARKLIASADVLIENFRPGVMARLGFGPQEACAMNPSLIYLSMPGFASSDAERAHIQAWEEIIASASGQFTDMGLNRVLMGINPSFSPLTLASAYGSVLGALSVAAALYAREGHGRGDIIEVPIASALMEGLGYNSKYVENYPERYLSQREIEIAKRRKAGQPMNLDYEDLQEFLDPFYRSYYCADGRPVYLVACSQVTHSHKALKVLGLLDEALEAGLPELNDWYLDKDQWPEGVDCALGLYPLSKKWADWLAPKMKERFQEKTSFEWEQIFGEAGAPLAAHRTTKEWLNSEHALTSGLVHDIEHPVQGRRRQAGPIAWLESCAEFNAKGELAPQPDQHRNEILESLAQNRDIRSANVLTDHGFDGSWLEGVRILDLTNVIAGPTVASTLSRFGAEVIKLDPTKPTFDPWNTIDCGLLTNRNKRSILADIKSEQGKDVLTRLVQWADVLTFNGLERQIHSLGIDYESLKAINPNIIFCRIDAYGGPRQGPRTHYVGYDDTVQASTGVMERFGGSLSTPEEHAHMGTIDFLAGFCGAFATATALYKRKRTGEGDIARASLSSAGQLIQIPFMYDFADRGPFDEPRGREAKGWNALRRCYEARDSWFFLSVKEEDIERLNNVEGLNGLSEIEAEERERFLNERFKTHDAAYWVNRLQNSNVSACEMGSLTSLRERYVSEDGIDPHASGGTYQFTRFQDHPAGRKVELISECAIRPQFARVRTLKPTEKYGKSTRQILKEIGFSDSEIERMIDEGVVSESWSAQYLPE